MGLSPPGDAGGDQGGLDEVEQYRQDHRTGDDCCGAAVEDATFAEAVSHSKRLLQCDRPMWSRCFYCYHRACEAQEQLSFPNV